MSVRRDEHGSATAEFAIVVPAALLFVLLAVAALAAAGTQIRLEHAAAQAARLAARGEDDSRAGAAVHAAVSDASLSLADDGELICATVSAAHDVPLPLPPLTARACAPSGGL